MDVRVREAHCLPLRHHNRTERHDASLHKLVDRGRSALVHIVEHVGRLHDAKCPPKLKVSAVKSIFLAKHMDGRAYDVFVAHTFHVPHPSVLRSSRQVIINNLDDHLQLSASQLARLRLPGGQRVVGV
eukprot:CAMPEP_0204306440 /NCGR_PEP_ID=MMETSP0468-20130131/85429_1 /ASSEMBLY_ACC=CAM_ASM_000383 /TAXON_ID=2969 /ORGANISM="Oxyrrhis marina" /LENGTH=127 /DNA_ID=CAMNT_0051285793 /DNA_START=768 /DNA_END=1148 /DNA_ORIENTATION=+